MESNEKRLGLGITLWSYLNMGLCLRRRGDPGEIEPPALLKLAGCSGTLSKDVAEASGEIPPDFRLCGQRW